MVGKIILVVLLGLSGAFMASASAPSEAEAPTVWDLGVLALATHDLRAQESERSLTNIEDSRLNLSTLYEPVDGRTLDELGHQKNSFNMMTTSVCRYFVDFHYAAMDSERKLNPSGHDDWIYGRARWRTVREFLLQLSRSFERITGLGFPRQSESGQLEADETIALLMGHDLLPGKIQVLSEEGLPVDADGDGVNDQYNVADRSLDLHVLNPHELAQRVAGFDGVYDPAFLDFERKHDGVRLNLMDIDKMIIGFLDRGFDFDASLEELADQGGVAGTSLEAAYLRSMAVGIHPEVEGEAVAFVPTDLSFLD